MKIDANSQALSKILTMESREFYHIPPYQRSYSWKNEQIDQLFKDIREESIGYYIGNILVTKHETDTDLVSTIYEVIDGQQRLTTLSLFLLALWQIAGDKKDADIPNQEQSLASDMHHDIGRRLLVHRNDPASTRLQLLDDDAQIYKELIRAVNEHEEPRVKKNRVFVKRYNHILELLTDADTFPDVFALYDFYDRLINVTILQIEAASIGDAFNIFSSLNSKGLPLTLVDLLKSEFLGMGSEHGNVQESMLETQWETLARTFAGSNADDDVDTTAFTQFFLNNYDAFESTTRSSVTKGKALNLYQTVIRKKRNNARLNGTAYLREMIQRARVYVNIIQLSDESCNNSLLENATIRQLLADLKQLESTQTYPLLLFLFVKANELELDAERMTMILSALVTFYVRRNIAEYPKSSNIRAKIIGTIRAIYADDTALLRGDDIVRTIVHTLKDISRNDEDFGKEILQRPIYDQNAKTTRFVLIDLEHALEKRNQVRLGTKERPVDLNDVRTNGKPRWTIEHILPEGTPPEHWQQMIAPGHPEDAENIKDDYTHRIGNLTLTAYNENMHQKPFADPEHPATQEDTHYNLSKRDYKDNGEYVGMRSQLQINTSIPQPGERIEDKTSWTIDDIKRRSEWFRDEMLKRYQFPDID